MNDLFDEGGDLNVRRTGPDEFRMDIKIPTDEHGLVGRECPSETCSPGYYKVKLGTGITEGQTEAFCPYCRHSGEPGDFLTKAQREYATDIVAREAQKGLDRIVTNALGLGPSGRKKLGSGMFSIEMTYKPGSLPVVPPPIEEELRRDLVCPKCGLQHAVFGIATWCPDCGADIFLTHIELEFGAIRKMLSVDESRRAELGGRIAARDTENALEDVVSIFEAVLKVITRRHLLRSGLSPERVTELFEKRIRNHYQNPSSAEETFQEQVGVPLFEGLPEGDRSFLSSAFEKRHPITHNLGVVDRKYLERAMSGDLEGREVRLTPNEVERAASVAESALASAYRRVFANPGAQSP